MLTEILRLARRLNDHWIGDLLGTVFLFASGYGVLLIGYAAGAQ